MFSFYILNVLTLFLLFKVLRMSSFSLSLLHLKWYVSLDCHNKMPQTVWLKQQAFTPRNSRSGCQRGWVLERLLFLACRQLSRDPFSVTASYFKRIRNCSHLNSFVAFIKVKLLKMQGHMGHC